MKSTFKFNHLLRYLLVIAIIVGAVDQGIHLPLSSAVQTIPHLLSQKVFAQSTSSFGSVFSPSGTKDITHAVVTNTYLLNYHGELNGSASKKITITLPVGLQFAKTPVVQPNLTCVKTLSADEKTYTLDFGTQTGTFDFSVTTKFEVGQLVHSNQTLSIQNLFYENDIERTDLTYQNFLTVKKYNTNVNATLRAVLPSLIYKGIESQFLLSVTTTPYDAATRNYIDYGDFDITIDFTRHFKVMEGSDYRYLTVAELNDAVMIRPQTPEKQLQDPGYVYQYEPTTGVLHITLNGYYAETPPLLIPFTFNIDPGTNLYFGTEGATGFGYENHIQSNETKFNVVVNSAALFKIVEEGINNPDEAIYSAYLRRVTSNTTNYIVPAPNEQNLFTLLLYNATHDLDVSTVTIDIPKETTITTVYVPELAFSSGATKVTFFNGANEDIGSATSAQMLTLTKPVAPEDKIILKLEGFIKANSIISNAADPSQLSDKFSFYGIINTMVGGDANSDGTGDSDVVFRITDVTVSDVGNTVTTTRSIAADTDKELKLKTISRRYTDLFTLAPYALKDLHKNALTNTMTAGQDFYLNHAFTLFGRDANSYPSYANKNIYEDPAIYFSLPPEITVPGDDYADMNHFEIVFSEPVAYDYKTQGKIELISNGIGFNGGKLLKVSLPGLTLEAPPSKNITANVYLKLHIPTDIENKIISFHPFSVGYGTTAASALGMGGGAVLGTRITYQVSGYAGNLGAQPLDKGTVFLTSANAAPLVRYVVNPSAGMYVGVQPNASTSDSYISYDLSNPTTPPTVMAGSTGKFKIIMENTFQDTFSNAYGYFVIPKMVSFAPQLTGLLEITAKSNVNPTIYYRTDEITETSTWVNSLDLTGWTPLTDTTEMAHVTALLFVADLAQDDFYEATIPYKIPVRPLNTDYDKTVVGKTIYNFDSATVHSKVAEGKTIAMTLKKSVAPTITTLFTDEVVEYWTGDATQLNTNLLNPTVTDQRLSTDTPFSLALDKEASSITETFLGEDTTYTFTQWIAQNKNIDVRKKDATYDIYYVSVPDDDGQLATADATVQVAIQSPKEITVDSTFEVNADTVKNKGLQHLCYTINTTLPSGKDFQDIYAYQIQVLLPFVSEEDEPTVELASIALSCSDTTFPVDFYTYDLDGNTLTITLSWQEMSTYEGENLQAQVNVIYNGQGNTSDVGKTIHAEILQRINEPLVEPPAATMVMIPDTSPLSIVPASIITNVGIDTLITDGVAPVIQVGTTNTASVDMDLNEYNLPLSVSDLAQIFDVAVTDDIDSTLTGALQLDNSTIAVENQLPQSNDAIVLGHNYQFDLVVVDTAGNESRKTLTLRFYDRRVSMIEAKDLEYEVHSAVSSGQVLLDSQTILKNNDVTATGGAFDADLSQISFDQIGEYDAIISLVDGGEHDYIADPLTIKINILDTTPPNITVETESLIYYKFHVGIEKILEDLNIQVTDNYDTNPTYTHHTAVLDTNTNGDYILEITAYDASGNASTPTQISVKILAPVLSKSTLVYEVYSENITEAQLLSALSTSIENKDALPPVSLKIENFDQIDWHKVGGYELLLYSIVSVGGQEIVSEPIIVTVSIQDTTAPVVTLGKSTLTYTGRRVSLEKILADAQSVVQDNYDLQPTYTVDASGLDVNTSGTYTLKIQGVDAMGNKSIPAIITVVIEIPKDNSNDWWQENQNNTTDQKTEKPNPEPSTQKNTSSGVEEETPAKEEAVTPPPMAEKPPVPTESPDKIIEENSAPTQQNNVPTETPGDNLIYDENGTPLETPSVAEDGDVGALDLKKELPPIESKKLNPKTMDAFSPELYAFAASICAVCIGVLQKKKHNLTK